MQKLKIILSSNLFLGFFLLIGSLFFIYTITNNKAAVFKWNETSMTGTIIKIKEKENNRELVLKIDSRRKLRVLAKKENDLKIGDKIRVEGKFEEPARNTVPNGFNYKYYLWYHQEQVFFQSEKEEKIGLTNNAFLRIKRFLIDEIESRKNRKYLKSFVLGTTEELTEQEKDSLKSNGINHLFSISGMHISLIIGLISIFIKEKKNSMISFAILNIILFGYLSLIDFLPSACRAYLLWNFLTFSKIQNLKLSKIKCFLWMFGTILFLKPFFIFEVGFQFSIILSFFFCLTGEELQRKSKIKELALISTLAFFVSLPITLYYYYEVNFLSILWNILIVPFVTIIFFPFQILSLIIPLLSIPAYYLGRMFECISMMLEKIDFLIMIFHKPSWIWIIIYYIFLILIIKTRYKKECICIIMILLTYLYHYNFIIRQNYFLMIDVGQGDSMLIHSNNKTMLLDTGGNFKKGTITEKKILPLLKSLGIRKIDVLCLSHGDDDHMGEAINLVENFKVEKVIFNCGSHNDLENELIRVLYKKNIKYYSCIKELNINSNKLHFLNTKKYGNENDNSNVIYLEFNNYKFLFMGDASTLTEKEILDKYNLPNIDVLKVGHHGSKTSSSKEFINAMNPKYSLISVGKNNRYHHPNKEALDNLKNSKIYRTDIDGSIMLKFKKGKLDITTCPP